MTRAEWNEWWMAWGAQKERRRIRKAIAPALRIIDRESGLVGWDDGTAIARIRNALEAIKSATRAPRRAKKARTP